MTPTAPLAATLLRLGLGGLDDFGGRGQTAPPAPLGGSLEGGALALIRATLRAHHLNLILGWCRGVAIFGAE